MRGERRNLCPKRSFSLLTYPTISSEILLMIPEPSAVCVTLLSENNFFIFASAHAVVVPVIAYVK